MTTDTKAKNIQCETLGLAYLKKRIKRLYGDADSIDTGARFGKLRKKVDFQRAHYYKREDAKPKLPPPYDAGDNLQSDMLRQTHVEFKARATENPLVVHATPQRPSGQRSADKSEAYFNSGLPLAEERLNISIQGGLTDGQSIDYGGWLHWRKADPCDLPDYEYCDDLPEDSDDDDYETRRTTSDQRQRFEELDDDHEERGKGRYRETSDSLLKRQAETKARAGFPWHIETPDAGSIAVAEDKSTANGYAEVIVVRRVPLPDYESELRTQDGICLSLHESNKLIPIYEERDAAPDWLDALSGEQEYCYVAQYWNREEYYELVAHSGRDWEIVKSFEHPYTMPPFAFAPGIETQSQLPEERWQPYLQGLYDIKPSYDRLRALIFVIAEMIALPLYYIQLDSGTPALDAQGKVMLLSRNSLNAFVWPQGAKLVKVDFELSPVILELMTSLREEMKESRPQTGQAEIGAGTSPWTVIRAQQQAAILVRAALADQARAIRTMVRNMAYIHSLGSVDDGGFGQPMAIYSRVKNGTVEKDSLVELAPEDIKTLDFDVTIDSISAADRITWEQHGIDLLAKELITPFEFVEQYRGKENASEVVANLEAYKFWYEYRRPVTLKQLAAQIWGNKYVLGNDLSIIGPEGQNATGAEVLAAQGAQQQGFVNGSSGGSSRPQVGGMGASIPELQPLRAGPGQGEQAPLGI